MSKDAEIRGLNPPSAAQRPPATPANGPAAPEPPRLSRRTRAAIACALVAVALASFFAVAPWASAPDTHAATIAALDEKKDTVMGLVAASAGLSAGISLLPGDAGTPIAEKLIDLSSGFLAVVTAIYLEKYLLTIFGCVAFRVLVPVACLCGAAATLAPRRLPLRRALAQWGARIGLFGLALCLVVPASIGASRMIEDTHSASIERTIAAAEQVSDEAADASGQQGANPITEIVSQVTGGVSGLVERAKTLLNDFIESLAVMVVTSCIIPLLVVLLFFWLVKVLLGVDVDPAPLVTRPAALLRRHGRP